MNDWLFDWDLQKNAQLKERRGICFEDIVAAIEAGFPVLDEPHPNNEKYPHQRMLIVEIDDYAIVVPYVENDEQNVRFLKTLYPSRKYTKFFNSL